MFVPQSLMRLACVWTMALSFSALASLCSSLAGRSGPAAADPSAAPGDGGADAVAPAAPPAARGRLCKNV